jgi:hypothetical protein
MVDTIQDYLDKRDTQTKWRSSPNIYPFRTADERFNPLTGVPIYSFHDTNSCLGWHQQTSSLDHKIWNLYQEGKIPIARRPRNLGGPFITTKLETRIPGRRNWDLIAYNASNGNPTYVVSGDLLPHVDFHRLCKAIWEGSIRTHDVWTTDDSLNKSELQVLGEKLMLSVVPTSAAFNAVTALGEPISDGGFFGLPGRSLYEANPGGEFLNLQFGILPTISDIQNFNTALETYSRVIKQYRRDANKVIRRRTRPYDLPEVVSSSTVSAVPITAAGRALNATLATSGFCTITKSIKRKVWYSGAFEYYIPKNMSKFQELMFDWQRAFHIAPSPADAWELLPFSWLTDYFTNGGNSIRHLTLQLSEGAVQRYGYVMCTSEIKTSYTWQGSLRINNVLQPNSITAEVVKTIKQRSRVSPFGVHFTGVDLNPRQLAILAALGIAK